MSSILRSLLSCVISLSACTVSLKTARYNQVPLMRALHSFWIGLLLTSLALSQSPHSESAGTSATKKGQQPVPAPPVPQFEDVAARVGLTVPHISSPDKKYIVESMSGGVGLI